ncbi:MAG TPA: NAD(P)H-binding protein [Cyclobacteriaceae bacterium]|nr:NAD(P)H-binding protein [Cyclobacteriaceae bacterium]
MIRKIAFIGVTGMLGKPVAAEMLKAGITVRALIRDPEKAKDSVPAGIEIVKGDLKNSADVDELMKGQDAVYVNLSVTQFEKKNDWHPETDGIKIVLASAKKNNLSRILTISSLVQRYQGMNNFNWWIFAIKEQSIAMVKNSRIPYTIFFPSTFMESFLGKYRQGKRILLAGKSKYPMYYIAGEDYGRQVVKSLQFDGNKEYVIQGPVAMTQEEASEIFVNNYRKEKLTISKAPLGLLRFLGLFSTPINYGAHIVEAMNSYPEKFESTEAWEQLGKPTITLKEFSEKA